MTKVIKNLWVIFLILVMTSVVCDWSNTLLPNIYWTGFWLYFAFVTMATIINSGLVPFVVKRLLEGVLVLCVIASFTFLMLRFLPGGPFDEEKALPPLVKQSIEAKYGLDKPMHEQYFAYMGNLFQGNLGYSYKYEGRPVNNIISEAFPQSFKLGFYALLLAFSVGIPIGVIAASKQGTTADTASMMLAISGVSLPSFLVAPLLIYIFSFGWPLNYLMPDFHAYLFNNDLLLPPALWESSLHYILPVITLGVRPAAFIARLTRASVLDVIQSDFVRTAKSKGLSQRVVLFKHVLKNSLIPVLSYAGPLTAGILSGTFVIEIIFAIPGIGKHFVQSVFNRDYPLILALTLMFSVMLIVANLVVDMLYKFVDPRMDVS